MLSLPDFKNKKIVTIYPWDSDILSLNIQAHTICLKKDGKVKNKILLHNTIAIFLIGNASITTNFIQQCQEYGISLFVLNRSFKLQSSLVSQAQGNYLLREKQYLLTEYMKFTMAKKLAENKAENQSQILKKYGHTEYAEKLKKYVETCTLKATTTQELLGVEGLTTRLYFQNLFKETGWVRRAPRTKEDIQNVLLDMGYTYLFNYIDTLLNLFGFDTYKGFYHELFYQRKSLTCDCMEPFRCIVEHALMKAYHLKRISEKDFIFSNGQFSIIEHKEIILKYQKIFLEEIYRYRINMYEYIYQLYRYFTKGAMSANMPKFIIKFE